MFRYIIASNFWGVEATGDRVQPWDQWMDMNALLYNNEASKHSLHCKVANHTSDRSTIHQLKLSKSLSFNICVRAWPCWLPTPNLQLHIFYLYSNKKEVYLPNNHIIEMISAKKKQNVNTLQVSIVRSLSEQTNS